MTLIASITDGMSGQDATDAINAAIASVNRRPVFRYVVNASDQPNSLCHADTGLFSAGDVILANFFDSNLDAESGGLLTVAAVRGSPYGGTPGTFANGGSTGAILEGVNYRFAVVPAEGGRLDIKRCGVRCVEGVTGWHSRFAEICAFAKNQQARITLVGSGVLSCTETVYLDRVYCDFAKLRFQGGTHASSGATVGPSTFFTASQSNVAVTFTTGTPVTVNRTAHGLAANAPFSFGTNGKLPGSLTPLTTYYVKTVTSADTFTISATAGGAELAATTAGNGNFFLFQGGTQSGVTTQDIIEWSGKVRRLGVVVRAGQNGSNKDYGYQSLVVWGDGNSDRTTPPSCIAIRHESDDSPNGDYRYVTNYAYVGVGVQGPAEKHALTVKGIYNRHLTMLLPSSSADTLEMTLHGANCQAWYTESEGTDTSVKVTLHCESRDDPASDASSEGDDAPAIYLRNGKATTLAGMLRANNGVRNILAHGPASTSGSSARIGADTLILDSLQMVRGYGIAMELRSIRYVAGTLTVKNWDDPNGPNAQSQPAFIVGRVVNAGGLHVNGAAIANTVGVRFGDASGFYPIDTHLGHWAIDMGATAQWNTDGTERTGSSGNPTTLDAWQVNKAKRCVIDMTGSRGRGLIDADALDVTVTLDDNMKQYQITKHASATATLGSPTLSATGFTIV